LILKQTRYRAFSARGDDGAVVKIDVANKNDCLPCDFGCALYGAGQTLS
jgi:hypothetical protein